MVTKHSKTNGDENLANREGTHSAAALQGNTVYQENMAAELARLFDGDETDFVKGDIGFPAYWKPDINKGWRGIVLSRDIRDPDFHRFLIENTGPDFDGRTGPARDGELKPIAKGQTFSISCHKALPLEKYYGLEVVVIATGKRTGMPGNEASDNKPRDMWEWELHTTKENQRLVRSHDPADLKILAGLQAEARRKTLLALAEVNPLNELLQQAAAEAVQKVA